MLTSSWLSPSRSDDLLLEQFSEELPPREVICKRSLSSRLSSNLLPDQKVEQWSSMSNYIAVDGYRVVDGCRKFSAGGHSIEKPGKIHGTCQPVRVYRFRRIAERSFEIQVAHGKTSSWNSTRDSWFPFTRSEVAYPFTGSIKKVSLDSIFLCFVFTSYMLFGRWKSLISNLPISYEPAEIKPAVFSLSKTVSLFPNISKISCLVWAAHTIIIVI